MVTGRRPGASWTRGAVVGRGPREHWPDDPAQRARIEADFDGRYGDGRQEIVFIGQHLDPLQMRARLDACLLDDAEMAEGPDGWQGLPDPFPAWTRGAEV